MLPRGTHSKIATSTKFSFSYIDQVLKGKRRSPVIMRSVLEILEELMLIEKSNSIKLQQIMAIIDEIQTP
jgi:hypothetical protein